MLHRDDVPLAQPCDEDWSSMARRAWARRHCASCQREVIDLSAMSEAEARAQLGAARKPCVRYHVDERGRVVHRPPVRRLVAALALVSLPAVACQEVSAPLDLSGETAQLERSWLDRQLREAARWVSYRVIDEEPQSLELELVDPGPSYEATMGIMIEVVKEPDVQAIQADEVPEEEGEIDDLDIESIGPLMGVLDDAVFGPMDGLTEDLERGDRPSSER